LERETRALPRPVVVPALPPPAVEAEEVVRELARAFTADLEQYRRGRGLAAERPDPAEPPPAWLVESILAAPPETVTFADLDRLTRADPATAAQRWMDVLAAARRDVAGGWHAARAVEPQGGSAWERAVFLAVREALHRAWPPRHDGEALLLDEMAQYEVLRRAWLGVLALHSGDPAALPARRRRGEADEPRRLTAAEPTAEAVRMVERLQRLFQAALRLFLAQRRRRVPLVFHGSGPVNVAVGRQLNMTATGPVSGRLRADDARPPAAIE
jgi:hypothetical protein